MGDCWPSSIQTSRQSAGSQTCRPKPKKPVLQTDGIHPSWNLRPRQSSHDCCHCWVCDVHWNHCQWLVSVGLQTARCWWAGLGVLRAEEFQDRLACLGAHVLRLEHPAFLPLRYRVNRRLKFSPEHQAVVYLCPVLRGIHFPSGGEILSTSARCIFHHHLVFPCFSGIQSPINPSPDLTGLSDVSGTLEGHRLEDNEPLRVPAVLSESCKFRGQHLEEAAPDSPVQRVISPRGNDHQVSPESLPCLVILATPTEVRYIVEVYPVPVYLSDPPVLPCGHVHRQIPRKPLPVRHLAFRLPHHRRCCDRVSLP